MCVRLSSLASTQVWPTGALPASTINLLRPRYEGAAGFVAMKNDLYARSETKDTGTLAKYDIRVQDGEIGYYLSRGGRLHLLNVSARVPLSPRHCAGARVPLSPRHCVGARVPLSPRHCAGCCFGLHAPATVLMALGAVLVFLSCSCADSALILTRLQGPSAVCRWVL